MAQSEHVGVIDDVQEAAVFGSFLFLFPFDGLVLIECHNMESKMKNPRGYRFGCDLQFSPSYFGEWLPSRGAGPASVSSFQQCSIASTNDDECITKTQNALCLQSTAKAMNLNKKSASTSWR